MSAGPSATGRNTVRIQAGMRRKPSGSTHTSSYYFPAANAVSERSNDNGAILSWQRLVADHWTRLRLDDLKVDSDANRHVFHVRAYLDELDPAAVHVELYAEARTGGEPVRVTMERGDPLIGWSNAYIFTA